VIKDSLEEAFTLIIKHYTEIPNDNNDDSFNKEEEEEDIIPMVYSDVLKALETLTLYKQ
jgi:hypothetical protein